MEDGVKEIAHKVNVIAKKYDVKWTRYIGDFIVEASMVKGNLTTKELEQIFNQLISQMEKS